MFEGIPFYFLTFLFILGLKSARKLCIPILIFIIFTSLFYSIIEGNVGALVRHRLQVVIFMIPFAANGLNMIMNKFKRNEA